MGTAASSNLGTSKLVAGLSCPSPCRGEPHLRRGPAQEWVPGGAAKAPAAPSLCSSHCSSRGARAAAGSCGSSSPFSPCSPGAAAASPGIWPLRSNSLPGRGLGRAGAGCSPGRGTPQCLLSNHLLPLCQEPSTHKQRRAPVRSTACKISLARKTHPSSCLLA